MSKTDFIKTYSVVSQKKGLDTTDLDGELVMMDIDNGKYYNFNLVGGRIWKMIEKPISIKEISNQLSKEFDIDEKKCETSVINFISKLKSNELIKIS